MGDVCAPRVNFQGFGWWRPDVSVLGSSTVIKHTCRSLRSFQGDVIIRAGGRAGAYYSSPFRHTFKSSSFLPSFPNFENVLHLAMTLTTHNREDDTLSSLIAILRRKSRPLSATWRPRTASLGQITFFANLLHRRLAKQG